MPHTFSARNKAIAFLLSTALAVFVLAGCSSGQASDTVAATVAGENIMESEVTAYIDSFRNTLGYSDDSAWAEYLGNQGMTPSQLRSATIYELAGDVVLKKKAEELGLSVSEDEVDTQINALRQALYATDDETWNSTLQKYGTNESDLRERYRLGLLEDKVYEQVVGEITPTDQDISSYIQENLLGTTTKQFSVFYGLGYTTLQSVLKGINDASSIPEGVEQAKQSVDNTNIFYEDFGWDLDPETTTYMQEELDELEVGQLTSNLVSDSEVGAYEIIYVTDSYTFPDTTAPDVNALPDGLKKTLSTLAANRVYTLSCSSWLSEQLNNGLTENEMPSGLSYDVAVNISNTSNTSSSNSNANSN
jgi:foldase protein PrsA